LKFDFWKRFDKEKKKKRKEQSRHKINPTNKPSRAPHPPLNL
jgi:hypothetical protein